MVSVPREARSYQGTSAGVVTRLAAGIVDALVVAVALAGSYAAWVALRVRARPARFRMPDPSLLWVVSLFFAYLVVYLTCPWWMAGRSIGDHLWGIRVTTRNGDLLGLVRAFARAVTCAVFPVGLLWCAVDRDRRAIHDLVLRTSVIYDWITHPSARWGDPSSRLRTCRHRTKGTSASIESVGVFSAMPVPIPAELPHRAVAEQLGHDEPRLADPEREGEAGELGAVVVDETAVGVADELQRVALVAADHEQDRVHPRVDATQVHGDHLVVALALAGEVVAEVHHGAVTGGEVVEERQVEELVAGELHGRGVEVDRRVLRCR